MHKGLDADVFLHDVKIGVQTREQSETTYRAKQVVDISADCTHRATGRGHPQ